MRYECTYVSTTLSMVMHSARYVQSKLTHPCMCVPSLVSPASLAVMAWPLYGVKAMTALHSSQASFYLLCLKVENFVLPKLSGLGRCGLTFCLIASNHVGKRLLGSPPFRNSCCPIAQVKGEKMLN